MVKSTLRAVLFAMAMAVLVVAGVTESSMAATAAEIDEKVDAADRKSVV